MLHYIGNAKFRIAWDDVTGERGTQVRFKNKTGANSVKGNTVCPSPTTDDAVQLVQTTENGLDTMAIVYEAGIADGSDMWCWAIGSVCEVLFVDGQTPTREHVAIGSTTVNGRVVDIVVPSTVPTSDEHWREVGHILQTKTAGTNVLALVCTHYN